MPAMHTPTARHAVRRRWRRVRLMRWMLAGLLAPCSLVVAERARAQDTGCLRVPFAQQIDVDLVNSLARSPPQALLPKIASLGIDVKRVASPGAARPPNPLLGSLTVADERLLQRAEFRDSYEGRAIPAGAACCGLERATVLIRDTASTYTLLHEVVHLLVVPADGVVLRADLESRFAAGLHRLNIYQRRLYDDAWRLLSPLWRRDIVQAQREVATLLFDRLRIGQSQEAIVEKVLAGCVEEHSPYFDATRRAEGRRYGEAMIDNAVDVFNMLHASIEFCDEAVRHMRADLAAGRLDAAPGASLSAQEHEAFAAELREIRQELARVRTEIESLKRFYAR